MKRNPLAKAITYALHERRARDEIERSSDMEWLVRADPLGAVICSLYEPPLHPNGALIKEYRMLEESYQK